MTETRLGVSVACRDGMAAYGETLGNHGVWMLRRAVGDRTEFMMFTLWESLDAVKVFAGEDYEAAVFYPRMSASSSSARSTRSTTTSRRPGTRPLPASQAEQGVRARGESSPQH